MYKNRFKSSKLSLYLYQKELLLPAISSGTAVPEAKQSASLQSAALPPGDLHQMLQDIYVLQRSIEEQKFVISGLRNEEVGTNIKELIL